MQLTRFAPAQQDRLLRLLIGAGLPTEGFDPAPDRTVVAHEGERLVGTASVHLFGAAALLRSVVVADDWRGRGLGAALTEEALRLARRSGAQAVYLLTETAAPFFSRLGFTTIARDRVPSEVAGDVEFTTLCPSSATVMAASLTAEVGGVERSAAGTL